MLKESIIRFNRYNNNFQRRQHQQSEQQQILNSQPEIIRLILSNNALAVRRLVEKITNSILNSNNNDDNGSNNNYVDFDFDFNKWIDYNGRTPLHLAASLGYVDILNILIKSNLYTINCRDYNLITPLHRCCYNDHLECLKLLLLNQADLMVRTTTHLTILHICSIRNSIRCTNYILKNYCQTLESSTILNATDSYGMTALHYAIKFKNKSIIKLLLENPHIKYDIQDNFGLRPIHYTIINNDTSILQLFLDIISQNKDNNNDIINVKSKKLLLTPLHLSIIEKNLESFKLLIKYGADLNVIDLHGNTILHWSSYIGHLPIIQAIFNYSFSDTILKTMINQSNLNGLRPLHYACMNPNQNNNNNNTNNFHNRNNCKIIHKIIEIFIEYYRTNQPNENISELINVQDNYKCSPLHYLHENNQNELESILKLMVENGADLNICDYYLETPIHKSIKQNLFEKLRTLQRFGAKINLPNKYGHNLLHLSAYLKLPFYCHYLLTNNDTDDDDNRFNVNWMDNSGRTAHYMAAYSGSIDCFNLLISSSIMDNGCDHDDDDDEPIILFPLVDAYKRNLLHYASSNKYVDIEFLEYLLSPNDHTTNNFGLDRTKRTSAKLKNSIKYTLSLLNINQQDTYGLTPLHYLCREQQNNTNQSMMNETNLLHKIQLFIKNGAKIDILDYNNYLPLHYVCFNNYSYAIEYLINKKWFDDLRYRKLFHHHHQQHDHSTIMNKKLSKCPLYIASYYGYLKVLEKLLCFDFNKLFNNDNNNNNEHIYDKSFEIAIRRKNFDCAKKLLQYCRQTKTIYNMAIYSTINGYNEIISLIFNYNYNLMMNNLPDIYDTLYFLRNHLLMIACLNINSLDQDEEYFEDNYEKKKFLIAKFLLEQQYYHHNQQHQQQQQQLLLPKLNINTKDNCGRNTLFYSVTGQNMQIIQLLLNYNIEFCTDNNGRNVFHLCALLGNLNVFKLLCNHILSSVSINIDLNNTSIDMNLKSSTDYLRYLLHTKDVNGYSPIEIACMECKQNILEYYLDELNQPYESLLLFAAFCCNDTFIRYAMKKYGQNVLINLRDKIDRTILHYYCMSFVPIKNFSTLKLFIENFQLDLNHQDSNGMTPLLYASSSGNYSILEFLLNNYSTKIDIMLIDNESNNILHHACQSKSFRTSMLLINYVKQLIKNDSDNFAVIKEKLINGQNLKKQTPLHIASKKLMPTIIKELLYLDANWNLYDVNGYSPSLYCTSTRLSAYCLSIIETFMIPIDELNQDNDDNNQTNVSSMNATTTNTNTSNGDHSDSYSSSANNDSNNTLEQPTTNHQKLSTTKIEFNRKNYEQIICDKKSRLSLIPQYHQQQQAQHKKLAHQHDRLSLPIFTQQYQHSTIDNNNSYNDHHDDNDNDSDTY